MRELENEIKDTLIKQKTGELIKDFNENPEYKAMALQNTECLVGTVINALSAANPSMGAPEKAYAKSILQTEIEKQYQNPTFIKKIMHEVAKGEYATRTELAEQLSESITAICNEEDIQDLLAKCSESFLDSIDTNQKFIEDLSKIAERKGIDKAVENETQYKVIREMYPTAEEYRVIKSQERKSSLDFLEMYQKILEQGKEETSKIASQIITQMAKIMKQNNALHQYGLEQQIKKIYKSGYRFN